MAHLEPLPIDSFLGEIADLVRENASLVLTAEPGAGKTTRLPPALLEAVTGQILVLEPRRMAAAAAATRIADERKWSLGREVGYQVRFDNRSSRDTRLIFMTEALLARRFISDPELSGVSLVVLDEFHERSLHVDLALGLLRELQLVGHPIKILVMSATMETEPLKEFLGGAPIVAVPGARHPLTIEYRSSGMTRRLDRDFYSSLAQSMKRAVQTGKGDILVFLPGAGEIRRAREELSDWAEKSGLRIESLHGSMDLKDQQRVIAPSPFRRIILSTNIAESSLTVNGVNTVVDSGLAKVMRQNPQSGFSQLEVSRIAKANADQRAGRAARQGPGLCLRLWSQVEHQSFPANELAEIYRTDISEALLLLAQLGISNFDNFSWYEAPTASQLSRARGELKQLQAIDPTGRITPLGKDLLRWPLPPRLGKLMRAAIDLGAAALGADLCAILLEREFVETATLSDHLADEWECDLALRVNLLRQYRERSQPEGVHYATLRRIDQASAQLLRLVPGAHAQTHGLSEEDRQRIRSLCLITFPDRLARRRATSDRAQMVGGRGLRIAKESMVQRSPFFIAVDGLDLEGAPDSQVHLAVGISKANIEETFPGQISSADSIQFDRPSRRFLKQRVRRFADLAIEETQPQPASANEVQSALGPILLAELPWMCEQNSDLKAWLERWNFLRRHHPEIANLSNEELTQALTSVAGSSTNLEEIARLDLAGAIEGQLEFSLRQLLEQTAPRKLQMPSGSWLEVHYPPERDPFLEVRIQEVFGLKENPKVAQGKVKVVLHLLGPNYRPMQTTADLASFWKTGYFEVRKELRARYPKHSWPEDPLTAPPQAKGRARRPT